MFVNKISKCLMADILTKVGINIRSEGVGCLRKFNSFSSLQTKWHLMSAAFVERSPVITQEKNKIETKFSSLLYSLEKEHSVLSDHELRHIEDQKMIEKRKNEDFLDSEAEHILQTAQELEDSWQDEFEAFQPEPRVTEADKTNDMKSLERKLDRKLILLMQQKLGNDMHWVSPMGIRQENESMREAAERVLSQFCGSEFQAEFLGNAPCGFYEFKYPANAYKDYIGAKVFFFKAHYISGPILQEQPSDYKWVAVEEIKNLTTKSYGSKVQKFVLE